MENYLKYLKNTFAISGISSFILLVLGFFIQIIKIDTNGYFVALQFLLLVIFIITFYGFLILTDVKNNKFSILKTVNNVLLIFSLLYFLYLCILCPESWGYIYLGYVIIIVFFNLLTMSIVYLFTKTGQRFFLKEWLFFLITILIMILYSLLRKKINF